MKHTYYILVGAGGFGREVMPIMIEQIQKFSNRPALRWSFEESLSVHFAVDEPTGKEELLTKVPVMRLDQVEKIAHENTGKVIFNIAIGDSQVRARMVNRLCAIGAAPMDLISKQSIRQPGLLLGAGAIVCAYVSLHANARIGDYFHANIYSYVAHDCEIGDYVTLAPAAKLNGGCKVGDHAYIGTGAILIPKVQIGARAIVGAGAVVIRDVPAGCTVVGNPARIIRQPTELAA